MKAAGLVVISLKHPYGSGKLMNAFWYNVLFDSNLYSHKCQGMFNEIAYHIDEERAQAQQQYNTCQHLVPPGERIDSQSDESLGSVCNVSIASTCGLIFCASTYRQAQAWSEVRRW